MLFRRKAKSQLSVETKQIIYEAYFDRVYKTALSLTRNPMEAEEITQETFTIAFEKHHQMREQAKLGAWLGAIALNLVRTNYNQQKMVVLMDPDHLAQRQDNSVPNIEAILINSETFLDLKKAFRELHLEFKDVLILKYYWELEIEEIAMLLEVPAGTVKSRLSRGRDKLRKIMLRASSDQAEHREEEGLDSVNRS